MSSDFLVWRPGAMKDGICKLKGLRNVSDSFEIHDGVSRVDGWNKEATAAMDPRFPKDLGLADSLSGTNFMVISTKVRESLEREAVGKVEFLPLKIVNHKGGLASDAYFIMNPLEIVDCIDKDASVVAISAIDDSIIGCKQLVLREPAISEALKVFRIAHWSGRILIRRGLAERIEAAGLTGMKFIEPQKYTGLT